MSGYGSIQMNTLESGLAWNDVISQRDLAMSVRFACRKSGQCEPNDKKSSLIRQLHSLSTSIFPAITLGLPLSVNLFPQKQAQIRQF
ncbi:hypothetical protein PoB_007099100 [Plakobranchus ocellatus]|uniref:Uncharacterized protein n=1 Tax=Plakobranchus ocellatus TaxID=259542 RepID=A0AAV4DKJ0_9GAST|nr:hypothetical protein PoB_007099100 [Plakobranchus ocellatus]